MHRLLPLLLGAIAACAQTPALPAGVKVEKNIAYSQYPETVLDVYSPASRPTGKRVCGVLQIHGGGWVEGSRQQVVERFVVPWLNKGCVVANIDYRLAKTAPAPAAVQDVLQAAKWFASHAARYNVDRRRIIATGDSAGGHLALMAAMVPKKSGFGPTGKIRAVINWYGITDVEDQLGGPNVQDYAVTWVPKIEGRMELARRVSPETWVRKGLPSVLTIHGSVDSTVPYDHGVRITKSLRDAGSDAEMINVSGGEHGEPRQQFDAVWPQVFEFLRRRGFFRER